MTESIYIHLKGGILSFDESDSDVVMSKKWFVGTQGYALSTDRSNGKYHQIMHRFILGIDDPKKEVDHKNHNKLDNRRCNLRISNRLQNSRNRSAWGASKYLGVHITNVIRVSKKTGLPLEYRYIRAQIVLNGSKKFLGHFKSEKDAALAYNNAATEYFGEFANLNQI